MTPIIPLPPFSMNSTLNYYGPHATKQDYDHAFNSARLWAINNPNEPCPTAARIYHVKEDALRQSVHWTKNKQRNSQGEYNKHGGNNKILNNAQEEAIRQYCYE